MAGTITRKQHNSQINVPKLEKLMGRHWPKFNKTLQQLVMKEYAVNKREIEQFLSRKTGTIKRFVKAVKDRYNRNEKLEDLYYAMSSVFVAAHVHGFDPALISAMAHVETHFDLDKVGSTGDYGIMQVTRYSAIAEFDPKRDKSARDYALKKFRRKLSRLGAKKFLGLVERKPYFDKKRLVSDALFGAMWGVRTLVFKYNGENLKTEHGIKTCVLKYQGGDPNYPKKVWTAYNKIYKPTERLAVVAKKISKH